MFLHISARFGGHRWYKHSKSNPPPPPPPKKKKKKKKKGRKPGLCVNTTVLNRQWMGTPDCKYMGNIFVDLIRTNVWANSPIRTSSYTLLWKYSPMKETQRAPVHTANLLLLQQLLLLLLIMIMMIIKTANFHYAKASMKWLFVSVSMLCGRGSEVRDKIESIKHRQLFRKKTLLKKT